MEFCFNFSHQPDKKPFNKKILGISIPSLHQAEGNTETYHLLKLTMHLYPAKRHEELQI
jgi:hypothetical protein